MASGRDCGRFGYAGGKQQRAVDPRKLRGFRELDRRGRRQGKSFNKYHPFLKRWEQYWVDGGPDRMFFTGHFTDGALRFETDGFRAGGHPVKRKLTFFPLTDGTVRQFSADLSRRRRHLRD